MNTGFIILIFIILTTIYLIMTLTKVNKKTAVVFSLNSRAGFFSVFFELCHSYIYSKENEYDFYITNTDWIYTYDKGWHDYFDSLNTWDEKYIENYDEIKWYTWDEKKYNVLQYIQAIKEIFIVKPHLMKRAQDYIDKLKEYNGIYIRRGDKESEMEIFGIYDILNYTDIQNNDNTLFVQTDDYNVVNDIKTMLPECNVKTTCLKQNTGSSYTKSLDWTKEQRKRETENLIIDVLVFTMAKHGWTDHRSNVGRFHKLYSYNNISLYPPPHSTYTMDTIINPGHLW
jgi:hypothetical protein